MSATSGDFKLGSTVVVKFVTTAAATGAPTTLSGTPSFACYPQGTTTELTAGVTLTVDYDARTGLNDVTVVASSGNGYATATSYDIVCTAGTVGGTSFVGYVVGSFSIEKAVVNYGSVNLPVGDVGALGIAYSGTAQSATATTLVLPSAASFADSTCIGMTIAAFGSTQGYWQYRTVTANVGSTDTLTVDTWTVTPSGTITCVLFGSSPASTSLLPSVNTTQFAGQTITAAAGVTLPSSVASPTNITAGTITTVTNLTNAPTAGDLTATMKTSVATASGNASYLKNTAAADIAFVLVDSTDHVTRKTGITVTAQRSLDHAAFGSATGTVTEIGNGAYVLSASAADMNANNIVFRFTGTACDPVELHIKTYT